MINLNQWAIKWGISLAALADLRRELGVDPSEHTAPAEGATTESGAAQRMCLQAANEGSVLWRNNVGSLQDINGTWVRYGLANLSKQMNKVQKSSDYVGIRPVLITHDMVGTYIGQFVARETKKPGWTYSGTEREAAQAKWMGIVIAHGGDACFSTGKF